MLSSLSYIPNYGNWELETSAVKVEFPDVGIPDDWKPQLDRENLEELFPDDLPLLIQAFHTSTGAHSSAVSGLLLTATAHAIQAIFDVQRGDRPPLPCSSMFVFI